MQLASLKKYLIIILFVVLFWTLFDYSFLRKTPIKPVKIVRAPLNDKSIKVIHDLRESIRKSVGSTVQLVGTNTAELEELQLERGGSPIRNLVVTSWSSGSTFLANALNTINGTFYFDEPLTHFGVRKFAANDSENEKEKVREHIKKLLNCDFSDMEDYLNHAKKYPSQFEHNHRLWSGCKDDCFSPSFLESYCREFPFISMTVIRSNLEVLQGILEEEDLKVRILLLVRDPRPTLKSRWNSGLCYAETYPACGSPKELCAQLVSDFQAAKQLSINNPKTFLTMRYEDIALNPYIELGKVLSFFGLAFNEEIMNFLDAHYKKENSKDALSTFRNTSDIFEWTNEFDWENLENIQLIEECTEAIKLWDYKIINNKDELKNKTYIPMAHVKSLE